MRRSELESAEFGFERRRSRGLFGTGRAAAQPLVALKSPPLALESHYEAARAFLYTR